MEEPTEEEYRVFFGRDHEYYYDKLEQYRSGTRITFNPWPFFLGLTWMLYRKMYLQSLLVVLLVFVSAGLESFAVQIFHISPDSRYLFDLFSNIFIASLLGCFGNYLYIRHATQSIKKIKETEEDEDTEFEKISQTGGITLIPHIIMAVLVIISLLMV